MGVYTRNSIVVTGLICYLDAGSRQSYVSGSSVWNDLSATGNTGSLTNAPTFVLDKGGSFRFNGSTNTIEVPDNPTLDLVGDKTLACWVYMGADSAGCGITGKSNSTVAGMALGYGWNGNGFMALAWNSTNNPFLVKDLARDIQKWVYLAAVQSGTTRYIYVCDIQGLRSSSYVGGTHTWDNTQSLTIGNANNGSNVAPANTQVAIVSVYNRALSLQEIVQNYNATKGRFGL